MMVFFLRHADAESNATSDFTRKLTAKGLEQAEKVGKFCARNGLVPDIILTSPVIRAKETASIVAKKLGDVNLLEENRLACGMRPDACLDLLKEYKKFEAVMLVGHEPDFSATISDFIGLIGAGQISVRKASLTAIEMTGSSAGSGVLQFFIPSRLM
ncbi:MAG: phosphohistidine phosphatase SixA [Chthoniobacterales bacterium]